MKPDWEKLAEEWDGSQVGLVAEIDCTDDKGKPLCDANGVKGFPTIKYGDPSSLEDYQGGRDYTGLAKFATENLKPVCSPKTLENCDDDKKKEIEELMGMSDDVLQDRLDTFRAQLDEAEETFKTEVQKLQEKYQELMEAKDAKLAAVKDSGMGLIKSVLATKKAAAAKDEL